MFSMGRLQPSCCPYFLTISLKHTIDNIGWSVFFLPNCKYIFFKGLLLPYFYLLLSSFYQLRQPAMVRIETNCCNFHKMILTPLPKLIDALFPIRSVSSVQPAKNPSATPLSTHISTSSTFPPSLSTDPSSPPCPAPSWPSSASAYV